MIFHETSISGVWLIEPERFADDRGFFARSFCREEFAARGLDTEFPQANVSFNKRKGTLRGMHFQLPPHGEGKLVRCSRGRVFDVAVDLRPDSESYCGSYGAELSAVNGHQLFIPKGVAHGFLTQEDDTEVSYLMSTIYVPEAGSGYRYDDPAFSIEWPGPTEIIAEKDLTLPAFDREAHQRLMESPGGE